jgi:choline transport protein
MIIISALSLVNVGSTTAFNALVSLSTLGLYCSYGIPILIFAIRRFNGDDRIEFGPWNLGRAGFAINVVAIVFCIFLVIFMSFPTELPVTANNMNYASVLFTAVIGFALVYYFVAGKKRYTGPVVVALTDESGMSPDSPVELKI